MYGVGSAGSFTIEATGSDIFGAIEMVVGSGYSISSQHTLNWEAFLSGSSVGTGSENLGTFGLPAIYGWSDLGGFDKLVFYSYCCNYTSNRAPAFDKVRVQLVAVPGPGTLAIAEPGTLAIVGLGLVGLGFARRKKAA